MFKTFLHYIFGNCESVAIGVFIGVFAWIFGENISSANMLKSNSSFGKEMVFSLLALALLALIAVVSKGPAARIAFKGLEYAMRIKHQNLLKASTVFFGVVIAAFACWVFTDSAYAIKSALKGLILSANLFFCWYGLKIIFDELINRSTSSSI